MTTKDLSALPAMPGFTFGCDPELFIFDENDQPIPAGRYIPGTKDEPFKVPCGALQRDGLAAEFNIDPVDNFQDFNRNCQLVISQMQAMLPVNYKLVDSPQVEFSEKVWDETFEDDKQLGCSPDFNAWTGEVNPPPDVGPSRIRCAGGHIHIGWTEGAVLSDEKHVQNCRDLVKQLDWYVGGWSVRQDADPVRRSLYGRAGACRYKEYGVEYRVPSNFWVMSVQRRLLIWDRIQAAIWGMRDNYMPTWKPESRIRLKSSPSYDFEAANNQLIEMINTSKRNRGFEKQYQFPVWDIDQRHVEL